MAAVLVSARSLRPAVDDGAAANGGDWRTHGAEAHRPISILRLIMGYGLRLTVAGILFGLASAIALTRAMQSMLVGVEPTDPVTYVIMSLVFFHPRGCLALSAGAPRRSAHSHSRTAGKLTSRMLSPPFTHLMWPASVDIEMISQLARSAGTLFSCLRLRPETVVAFEIGARSKGMAERVGSRRRSSKTLRNFAKRYEISPLKGLTSRIPKLSSSDVIIPRCLNRDGWSDVGCRQPEAGSRSIRGATGAVQQSNDVLALKLDVTNRSDAEAAVRAAVHQFGRIDVLVNNAASFYAGYFEELTPEQFDRQLSVQPHRPDERHPRRAAGDAQAALRGTLSQSPRRQASPPASLSAYAASKFGLEGWMESLQAEVAPFGIASTIVNPGFFRTGLLTEQSTNYAEPSIADYDERRGPLVVPGSHKTGSNPATRRSSRGRSSQLPARSRRRAASSLAAMRLPLRSRESPTLQSSDRREPGPFDIASL